MSRTDEPDFSRPFESESLQVTGKPSPHPVYECWVSGQSDTGTTGGFTKRTDTADIALWVAGVLGNMDKHAHLHIVKHISSEYSS